MKEDILEQLVDDYLQSQGYFTRHNIKFWPREDHVDFNRQADCVPSDIDVLGFNPKARGRDKVIAVSCKSWQYGFDCGYWIGQLTDDKNNPKRPAWKKFREIVRPKWSQGFLDAVQKITGTRKLTYMTAVTRVRDDPKNWERHLPFQQVLEGNQVKLLTLTDILNKLNANSSTTPASSAIGRILQLMRAAKQGGPALSAALADEEENE